eukprot:6198456-Pleurochrysis_carterae.AAC.6
MSTAYCLGCVGRDHTKTVFREHCFRLPILIQRFTGILEMAADSCNGRDLDALRQHGASTGTKL